MHVKNSESQRKTNTKTTLKHPINHRDMNTPQNRQQELKVCSERGWVVLTGCCPSLAGGSPPCTRKILHTLYREFCSKGKCFTRGEGPLTVSAGLGKWCGIHKGVKL